MSQALQLIKKIMDQANPLSTVLKGIEGKEGLSTSHSLDTLTPNKPTAFGERVRESHAKLAAKKAKAKAASRNNQESNPKPTENQQAAQAAQSAKKKIAHDRDLKSEVNKNSTHEKNDPINRAKSTDAIPNGKEVNIQAEENYTEAEMALKDRLEKMGVMASDEQLSDPNFLIEMLQYLQGINTIVQGVGAENVNVQASSMELEANQKIEQSSLSSEAAVKQSEKETVTDLMTSGSGEISDYKSSLLEKSASPKELGELIKDRLTEITKNTDLVPESGLENSTAARVLNAKQGLEVNLVRSEDSIDIDPIPSSDLDKLRVMQASGLLSDTQDVNSLDSLENAEEENQEIREVGNHHATADSDLSDASGGEGKKSEHFGQNQSSSQPAGSNGSLATSQGAKDVLAGNQFHQTLENVKSSEVKNSSEPVWTPQRTAFEQSVLQQISKKLSSITHTHGGQISLQLEPENLGKIRVGMGLKDGIMTAHISVENEKIREIVDANLPQLRETLENQGIKLQSLDVSVDQQHSSLFNPEGTNSQGFFQGRGQTPKNQDFAGETINTSGLEIAPESDTGRRLGYNTLEYIG